MRAVAQKGQRAETISRRSFARLEGARAPDADEELEVGIMPEQKPRVGDGDVTIWLDGEERTLVPTAEAFYQINRQFGGLGAAFDRVMQMDADAIAVIIVAGARVDPKEAQALPDKIYRTGLGPEGDPREVDAAEHGHPGLQARCVRYLEVLRCGGRHPSKIAKDTDRNPPQAGA